ncbi:energy-coupling factor ABC transporter ATP-binding protein [Streptomyces sp. NPDC057743]|uniref:energy-coupling factor ABC transporter ATP-binding protein n=1 Tax=Streptomyces sp. NPDC057743 TaxID=3346236 RepID=UPI003686B1A5
MIEIDGVSHRFGERWVLDDITLTLDTHRVGVVGSNGSGKSTFARLLNGLLVPEKGRVRVNGLDTARKGREVRRQVGFVFQDPDVQIVMPTVAEDLAFGLKHHGLSRAETTGRVEEVLVAYGLSEFRDHPAHLLSGGQKQLLAIAAVLALEPRYVVFDEPTTLLDLGNRRRVTKLIRELPQHVVVVSHDLELLAELDRVIVLDRGRVVADGPPRETIAKYEAMHPPL